jgi:hypothetical protein
MTYPRSSGDLVQKKVSARKWKTVSPFWYFIDERYLVHVPIGFEHDLASIPRLATPIIPKIGRHDKAALVHDWLYECGWVETIVGRNRVYINRKDADKVFYQALVHFGVKRGRAWAMYHAVRLFGWRSWSKQGHHDVPCLF